MHECAGAAYGPGLATNVEREHDAGRYSGCRCRLWQRQLSLAARAEGRRTVAPRTLCLWVAGDPSVDDWTAETWMCWPPSGGVNAVHDPWHGGRTADALWIAGAFRAVCGELLGEPASVWIRGIVLEAFAGLIAMAARQIAASDMRVPRRSPSLLASAPETRARAHPKPLRCVAASHPARAGSAPAPPSRA